METTVAAPLVESPVVKAAVDSGRLAVAHVGPSTPAEPEPTPGSGDADMAAFEATFAEQTAAHVASCEQAGVPHAPVTPEPAPVVNDLGAMLELVIAELQERVQRELVEAFGAGILATASA